MRNVVNLDKKKKAAAFSLAEVVIALGLVSFSVIATFGLIAVGLDSSRESVNDTIVGLIFRDAASRIEGKPLAATGANPYSYYYDRNGVAVNSIADPSAYYEVKVSLVNPSGGSGSLLAVLIEARWPLVSGALAANSKTSTTTTYVTTLTPPQWKDLQNSFVEKVELCILSQQSICSLVAIGSAVQHLP